MLSVTSDATASVSFQNARQKPARDDRSPPSDSFGALVDANAQASQTVSPSNSSDPQGASPDRRASDVPATQPRGDATAATDDNSRPRDTQTSGQPPADSAIAAGPGIQKPAAATDESTSVPGHATKPASTKVATTKETTDATTADPAASQPIATPIAVAVTVTVPMAATPTTAAKTAGAAAVAGSVTDAPQTAAILPAQTAETGATTTSIAQDTNATPAAQQTNQTATAQTGFAAGEAVATTVAAATPVTAKATAKTLDNAQSVKGTSPVTTGPQPGTTATDAAIAPATATGTVAQHDAATGNPKHDTSTTDSAKSASPGTGTPVAQSAAQPQHAAHTTDTATSTQTGQTDASQQVINTAIPQPQVQSTTGNISGATQFNVTVATGAAVPLNGLAVQIAFTAQSGKSRFEIRLDPADLGRIDVRLDVDRQGQVTSHLAVEKPETLAMLRQDAPQLQRALQDAGLKTGDGGLQFSLRDQSSQGQTARDDTGRNAQRLIVTEDDLVPAASAGRTYGRMLGSSSGLDIRV
ncbi:MAG: flagellar hook-length control protein FliK [Proteobacteria bacterium]|nr:flagellar hook-length control protein FliK [Pseudomonadota bacterium]